jgi:phosphatidylserine decarboxylase
VVVYGIYYAAALLAGAGVVTWIASWPYGIPFYILAAFCLNFFRDPDRQIPDGPVAVSPADGKVVSVKALDDKLRVSIFLNIFDVHVNRTPIGGKIACISYKRGDFKVASTEEASDANEQNVITLDGTVAGRATRIVFKQIAGLIARRLICYKKAGDIVTTGERIGLMKFGSRIDVFFGPEWDVAVRVGERVVAGSSILARIKDA